MIKVTHIISSLFTGGAEMMLYKLLTKMDKTRFSNTVISLTDKKKVGDLGYKIEELGIPVYYLNMNRFSFSNVFKILTITKLVYRERPHILQTWLYHSDLLGLFLGKLLRVPNILWNIRCSDMDMKHYSRLTKVVIKVLAVVSKWPDAVIINSKVGKEFHRKLHYVPKRWELIPNGFDLDLFSPNPIERLNIRNTLDLDEKTILIGNISRFDPMKDHYTFLSAVKVFIDKRPDVHFILAGRKINDENLFIKKIIKDLNLQKNVHLLGERKDISFLLPELDIVSISSCSEGFPNVIGEAMACGVPCVATDVGDSLLIVGDTGRVVPRKNPMALAEAWLDLIEKGSHYRKKLGLAARRRIQENYDLFLIVGKYQTLYEEFAEGVRN